MQLWDTYIEKYRESYIVWRDLEYEDFQDFWNKYGKDKNPDFWLKGTLILGWLENIGVLVKGGLLDKRLIALSFAGLVRQIWEKLEPILPDLRVKHAYPRLFSETEYLCKDVLKYMEEHPELKT